MILNKNQSNLVEYRNKIWNSPTVMTWGSFLSRSMTFFIVLPLVFTRLQTTEIAIWFLFSTIINMQSLADIGLSPTFARVIAYAMAGSTSKELKGFRHYTSKKEILQPNWNTIASICSTMRKVYSRITYFLTAMLLTFGSWSLLKPVSALPKPLYGWLGWSVIVCTSIILLRGHTYSAYLQGTNKIALLRRWEMFTSLGTITTNTVVLLLGWGLIGLVVSQQIWVMINILRNRFLCRKLEGGKFIICRDNHLDKEVFHAVWPSAWRSGMGILMSHGLLQATGLIYAQYASSGKLASYLLGLRIVQMISQFSMGPFYSKIPALARLRVQGDIKNLVKLAKRGMTISYWSFVASFALITGLAPPLMKLIKSNASFPSPWLWALLGLAMIAERFGAMHIQLYSTTNHIIWHIANGVTGSLFIVLSLIFTNFLDEYAFPLSLLLSNLLFYCWYSAKHSYASINGRFLSFENKVFFAPASAIMLIVFFYII